MGIRDERHPLMLKNSFVSELGMRIVPKLGCRNDSVTEKIIPLAPREDASDRLSVARINPAKNSVAADECFA